MKKAYLGEEVQVQRSWGRAFQEGLRNGKGTNVATAENGGRFYERRGET